MSAGQPSGSLLLFQSRGIRVFLHWSWFLVAAYEIMARRGLYSSLVWNVYEYLALFVIVLLHEFGHALACRQVGGNAERILLWPLGGIAFVSPPQRPGAVLWSIAAGPLVNVVLAVVFFALDGLGDASGFWNIAPDSRTFLDNLMWVNGGLLVFNLLPAYPLDGGQILRALLWFPFGRVASLRIASVIGAAGAALLLWFSLSQGWMLSTAVGAFMLWCCWSALGEAKALSALQRAPRHGDKECPRCHAAPAQGAFWACAACRTAFDVYATGACPDCGLQTVAVRCGDCGTASPLADWSAAAGVRRSGPGG
jgi:Zn-dependent protease